MLFVLYCIVVRDCLPSFSVYCYCCLVPFILLLFLVVVIVAAGGLVKMVLLLTYYATEIVRYTRRAIVNLCRLSECKFAKCKFFTSRHVKKYGKKPYCQVLLT